MTLSAKELEKLICNIDGNANGYLRSCIGTALCKALYDSANSPEDYPGEYGKLYDASFYNRPDDDDIFLCLSYIENVLQENPEEFELTLSL